MTREEFTGLATNGDFEVPQSLYDAVEYFYTADNHYHTNHGGVDEDKHAFVHRVFGAKVSSLQDVVEKIALEAINENRWALRGNQSADEARLAEMDRAIVSHYQCMI